MGRREFIVSAMAAGDPAFGIVAGEEGRSRHSKKGGKLILGYAMGRPLTAWILAHPKMG